MAEYGTPNIDIEEGWLEIEHKGRKDKFLYPRQASSLYHTTKIMDTDLMWFGVRMWDLRITDLMQGPVYGIETEESEIRGRRAEVRGRRSEVRGRRAESKEQRAKSKEQRAKSREQRAKSKEQRAKSRES